MGIGLTLSQDAARAMGGSLSAKKNADSWLEFVLILPAVQPHGKQPRSQEVPA